MGDWLKDKALPRIGLYIPDRAEGQGMAEYGFILSGVALLAILAVFLLGPQIGRMLNKVAASIS